jgi:Rad3-related DNA helicase
MINDELKALVIDEATKLREHATQEERDRLDLNRLDPSDIKMCIYGQMTGDCYSARTAELLGLCARPYSGVTDMFYPPLDGFIILESGMRSTKCDFTAIECYITSERESIKNLINYLKGSRETLTINDL